MTLVFLGKEHFPNYIAVSDDISDSTIAGLGIIGATVYATDTQRWYITTGSAMTLAEYKMPRLYTVPESPT